MDQRAPRRFEPLTFLLEGHRRFVELPIVLEPVLEDEGLEQARVSATLAILRDIKYSNTANSG